MIDKPSRVLGGERHDRDGFTLMELLVVIFVIALLAALLAPAMASSGMDSAAAKCMSNFRQVSAAWQMYANENMGVFAYNTQGEPNEDFAWIAGGWLNYEGSPDDTDLQDLLGPHAQIAPYIKTAALFKCPTDMSLSFGTTGAPRIRSYSMSQAIGYGLNGQPVGQGQWLPSVYAGGPWQCYFKESDLGRPAPSKLWLLVDENPDSINDAAFAFEMPSGSGGSDTGWIDIATKLHGNACGFGFVDGHAEIHQWMNPQGLPNTTYQPPGTSSSVSAISGNTDVWWVAARTSAMADGSPDPFPDN
jgi:prepilin-type N-terminal cleavage/methylation domain-containing protein/prepilin-type processing-associated H-X9-DG protein